MTSPNPNLSTSTSVKLTTKYLAKTSNPWNCTSDVSISSKATSAVFVHDLGYSNLESELANPQRTGLITIVKTFENFAPGPVEAPHTGLKGWS